MKKFWGFLASVIVFFMALFGLISHDSYSGQNEDISPSDAAVPTAQPVSEGLEIRFLDVGQGDAALLFCDGKTMLIDGGETRKSSFLYAYLKEQNITDIDILVATHTHEDHIGGLAGALNFAKIGTAYANTKESDSASFQNFLKYLSRQDKTLEVLKPGDSFSLGSATVDVLAPFSGWSDKENDNSIVLRITYGRTSFLFMGDAGEAEEQSLLQNGCKLKSTVLKVAHHGSSEATSEVFLSAVKPQYAVISVGADNKYGHPTETVLDTLTAAGAEIYRTDRNGTILCRSDGKKVSFTVSKEETAETTPEATLSPDVRYILNTNSMKFHRPDCESAGKISVRNRIEYSGEREDLIKEGYTPCGVCRP